MMTNSLRRWIGPFLWLSLLCLIAESGFAQNEPRSAPQQQRNRGARQAPADRATGVKPASEQQPAQPQIDPKLLDDFLANWEKHTKGINSLEGRHTRFTYDFTWSIEKRAVGEFYYEAPDKGRIDLHPDDRIKKDETKTVNGKVFKVEPADPEMWISNGKEIIEVNEKDKSFSKFPLPANLRGKNIMDGPLPFLFGMPADVAKARYDMQLVNVDIKNKTVRVKVKPLWGADAANYSEAELIISTVTYLPHAVKLVHPGGNEHTVYSFGQLDINKEPKLLQFVFGKNDPFNPPLRGYREIVNEELNAGQGQGRVDPKIQRVKGELEPSAPKFKPGTVPDLQGMHYKKAEETLKAAGYVAKWHKGKVAGFKDQIYTTYDQSPRAGDVLAPGETVHVKLYNALPKAQKSPATGK